VQGTVVVITVAYIGMFLVDAEVVKALFMQCGEQPECRSVCRKLNWSEFRSLDFLSSWDGEDMSSHTVLTPPCRPVSPGKFSIIHHIFPEVTSFQHAIATKVNCSNVPLGGTRLYERGLINLSHHGW